jgi:four helix bundle protein
VNTGVSRANLLEERLINFAASIINFSAKMPRTPIGRHIALQMVRSGTSAAANYGEARGAESRGDFIHKMRIVQKELNETGIWLRILSKTSLIPPTFIVALVAENTELSKIITASVKTARTRTASDMGNGH